ncbi:hypothetical protein XI05_01075 [Bradyrhizobium sp. CCBAU 11357]|nr:hypothetical protein [Bradyrhizobium sp. CCBAU 11357]
MRLACEYKNLEILFGDLAAIGPHKPFDVFEAEHKEARGSIRGCQQGGVYSAGVVLQARQGEIRAGHYTFGDDLPR